MTGSVPLQVIDGCVSFTSVVSARWPTHAALSLFFSFFLFSVCLFVGVCVCVCVCVCVTVIASIFAGDTFIAIVLFSGMGHNGAGVGTNANAT